MKKKALQLVGRIVEKADEAPRTVRQTQNHSSRAAGVFGVGVLLEALDALTGSNLRRTFPVNFPYLYEALQMGIMTLLSAVDVTAILQRRLPPRRESA